MARVAIERGVRPEKREPVQVIVDLLNRDVPSVHGVALLATGTELALMNIGVTVGTLRSHIRENGLGVALGAGNVLM